MNILLDVLGASLNELNLYVPAQLKLKFAKELARVLPSFKECCTFSVMIFLIMLIALSSIETLQGTSQDPLIMLTKDKYFFKMKFENQLFKQ